MKHFLAYLYSHNLDPYDDDDVKDAIVESTCYTTHWTDEELDEALAAFRAVYG